VVERNLLVYRRAWMIPISGFFEPVFYLLAMAIGIGALIGDLPGPDGRPISYVAFVAPGLLAASAMNGSLSESTYQLFLKLIDGTSYHAMLATPIDVDDLAAGEAAWSVVRGFAYCVGFLVMALLLGAIGSWWAVLALPAALLICACFAAIGQVITGRAQTFTDLDIVGVIMLPMFLCSATFFPLSTYPTWAQGIVVATPLYHGVALERGLTTGVVGWSLLLHVTYLVLLTVIMLSFSIRQLRRRLID
jgi:lipooligosaccharide transport system permease protein